MLDFVRRFQFLGQLSFLSCDGVLFLGRRIAPSNQLRQLNLTCIALRDQVSLLFDHLRDFDCQLIDCFVFRRFLSIQVGELLIQCGLRFGCGLGFSLQLGERFAERFLFRLVF